MTEHLSAEQAHEIVENNDTVLVDLRPPSAFAQGHPASALSLPFSPRGLIERLSVVVPAGTPVILLASRDVEANVAVAQLQGGPFPVRGILQDGIQDWQEAGLPVETIGEISAYDLDPHEEYIVLDVREPMEWEIGHVPEALLISLRQVRHELHRIPRNMPVAVICEGGIRSCTAASILKAEGFENVLNVPEGTRGYRNAGLELAYWMETTS